MNVLNLDHIAALKNLSVRQGVTASSNPGPGSPGLTAALSANQAASSQIVFHAGDVPQPVDYLDVFTTSFVNVSQSLAIGSLSVQLNITYPLDNDLTIDLIAPDGTDVPLSSFEGSGANFQNTFFDDVAAVPIGAGNSPFVGSYQPESPLSRLAGTNAQGTWELQIIDYGAGSGTLNSWSLIVNPVGNPAPSATSPAGGPSTHLAAADVNMVVPPSVLASPTSTVQPPIQAVFSSSGRMMDAGKPTLGLAAAGPVIGKVADFGSEGTDLSHSGDAGWFGIGFGLTSGADIHGHRLMGTPHDDNF
jgi:subtilisin-like proprotein convertase family protein